jgi:hypothetical protein
VISALHRLRLNSESKARTIRKSKADSRPIGKTKDDKGWAADLCQCVAKRKHDSFDGHCAAVKSLKKRNMQKGRQAIIMRWT